MQKQRRGETRTKMIHSNLANIIVRLLLCVEDTVYVTIEFHHNGNKETMKTILWRILCLLHQVRTHCTLGQINVFNQGENFWLAFFKLLNSSLPFFHWINNVLHCINPLLHWCYLKTVLQPIRMRKSLHVFY